MVVCMEVVLILLIDVGGLSLKVGSLSLDPDSIREEKSSGMLSMTVLILSLLDLGCGQLFRALALTSPHSQPATWSCKSLIRPLSPLLKVLMSQQKEMERRQMVTVKCPAAPSR